MWGGGDGIVIRPFTSSVNERGNTVYNGVVRNTNESAGAEFTVAEELVPSKELAAQVYRDIVSSNTEGGFILRPDWVALWEHNAVSGEQYTELWIGQRGDQQVYVWYEYLTYPISSWTVTTESHY